MDPSLVEVLKIAGQLAVLFFFFMKVEQDRQRRDEEREKRLGARLDTMHDQFRDTMHGIVNKNTEAMVTTSAVLKEQVEATKILHLRLCDTSPLCTNPPGGTLGWRKPTDHNLKPLSGGEPNQKGM